MNKMLEQGTITLLRCGLCPQEAAIQAAVVTFAGDRTYHGLFILKARWDLLSKKTLV